MESRVRLSLQNPKPDNPASVAPASAHLISKDATQKVCQALKALACQRRGGELESDRPIRKSTRYCRDCGPLVRLAQNAKRKRSLRRQRGWQQYRDDYSPFLTREEQEAEHREYMRAWRAWRHHRHELNCALTETEERKYRAEFIKTWRRHNVNHRESQGSRRNSTARVVTGMPSRHEFH